MRMLRNGEAAAAKLFRYVHTRQVTAGAGRRSLCSMILINLIIFNNNYETF